MGTMAQKIETKLRAAFDPAQLNVRDVSASHAGHAGARPGGNTHFEVDITAAAFDGLSRVAAQRAVMAVLQDEFADTLHALSLKTRGVQAAR